MTKRNEKAQDMIVDGREAVIEFETAGALWGKQHSTALMRRVVFVHKQVGDATTLDICIHSNLANSIMRRRFHQFINLCRAKSH